MPHSCATTTRRVRFIRVLLINASSRSEHTCPGELSKSWKLDRDTAIQQEVRNAARTLCEALRAQRAGRLHQSGQVLAEPRPK